MPDSKSTNKREQQNPQSQVLDRQLSRNWYLLASVAILSTLGMAIAVAPALSDRLANIWPWENTHIVLLSGLIIAVALLITHLTVQQRKVTTMKRTFKQLEADTLLQERQNRTRLRALLNISQMMGAVNDPENVFSSITSTCKEIFESE